MTRDEGERGHACGSGVNLQPLQRSVAVAVLPQTSRAAFKSMKLGTQHTLVAAIWDTE